MPRRVSLAVRNRLYVLALHLRAVRFRLLAGLGVVRVGPRLQVGAHVDLRVYGELRIGSDVFLDRNCSLQVSPGAILIIGDYAYVGQSTVITAARRVEIGAHVLVAEHCSIRDSDHQIEPEDRRVEREGVTSPVLIAPDVWIGAGVRVLRGSRIGAGAIVAANAVVRSDIPERSVAAGVPARVVKEHGRTGRVSGDGDVP